VQKTIQHLEWTDCNQFDGSAGFEDEDVMFASTGFSNPKLNIRKKRHPTENDPYSYWGATIRKNDSI